MTRQPFLDSHFAKVNPACVNKVERKANEKLEAGLIQKILVLASFLLSFGAATQVVAMDREHIQLPEPVESSNVSVEDAIGARRSVRRFSGQRLSDEVISRLLWSAQGITESRRNLRAVPSAGPTYPLELYLIDQRGVFHYQPTEHRLKKIASNDRRSALARAALGQDMISQAAPLNHSGGTPSLSSL